MNVSLLMFSRVTYHRNTLALPTELNCFIELLCPLSAKWTNFQNDFIYNIKLDLF